MSGPLGFVLPAISLGLGSLLIKPKRGFFPSFKGSGSFTFNAIIAQATLEEVHHDEIQITDHPVERGAMISDHAFKRPAEVVIKCAWSNSPSNNPGGIFGAAVAAASALGSTVAAAQSLLNGNSQSQIKDIYEQLLALQVSGKTFDIFTGKRAYTDMLFRSLSVTTDVKSENSLLLTAVCRQVIIVSTHAVSVPINTDAQSFPEKTAPVQNAGLQKLLPAQGFVMP